MVRPRSGQTLSLVVNRHEIAVDCAARNRELRVVGRKGEVEYATSRKIYNLPGELLSIGCRHILDTPLLSTIK